jgi:HD-like signal output (HDOD) protein
MTTAPHDPATVRIPPLPGTVVKLLEILQKADCDLGELQRVIELDPVLAGKLLRLSNGSFFGLGKEVTSLRQALIILGLRTVRSTALAFAVAGALPKSSGMKDFERCWRRVMTSAMAGKMIAESLGADHDEAFTAGLLQEVGGLMLAASMPDRYEAVFERAGQAAGGSFRDIEREITGHDHAEFGAGMLQRWGLPELLVDAVRRHHDEDAVRRLADGKVDTVTVMGVSEIIVDFLQFPNDFNLGRFDELAAAFGGDPSKVDVFLQKLDLATRDLASMFNMALPPGERLESLVRRAREGAYAKRVLENEQFLSASRAMLERVRPGQDALLILVARVEPAPEAGPPLGEEESAVFISEILDDIAKLSRDSDILSRLDDGSIAVVASGLVNDGVQKLALRLQSYFMNRVVEIGGRKVPVIGRFGSVACQGEKTRDADLILKTARANLAVAVKPGEHRLAMM